MQLTIEIDEALLVRARAALRLSDDSVLVATVLELAAGPGGAQLQLRAMRGAFAESCAPWSSESR